MMPTALPSRHIRGGSRAWSGPATRTSASTSLPADGDAPRDQPGDFDGARLCKARREGSPRCAGASSKDVVMADIDDRNPGETIPTAMTIAPRDRMKGNQRNPGGGASGPP